MKLQRLKTRYLAFTGLATTASQIENNVPDITNLATKAALNTKVVGFESNSKITGVSNLIEFLYYH